MEEVVSEESYKEVIARQCNTTSDKVTLLPYRAPADYPDPTPLRIWIEKEYTEWAERSCIPVEELGYLVTHDVVYDNPFKGGKYWLTTLRST